MTDSQKLSNKHSYIFSYIKLSNFIDFLIFFDFKLTDAHTHTFIPSTTIHKELSKSVIKFPGLHHKQMSWNKVVKLAPPYRYEEVGMIFTGLHELSSSELEFVKGKLKLNQVQIA